MWPTAQGERTPPACAEINVSSQVTRTQFIFCESNGLKCFLIISFLFSFSPMCPQLHGDFFQVSQLLFLLDPHNLLVDPRSVPLNAEKPLQSL